MGDLSGPTGMIWRAGRMPRNDAGELVAPENERSKTQRVPGVKVAVAPPGGRQEAKAGREEVVCGRRAWQ